MSEKTERQGQYFGVKCWNDGLTVQETLNQAAQICGLASLPENAAKWPKFVHGAEEAWQDKNLARQIESDKLSGMVGKHVKA